jgi:AcrR family transcriptional regulator
MPPRPSRNLDRALLAAGRELFPTRGCAGLSVREVADAAGVNLGMFHYHFKSREAFLRALLQSVYEEMFAELSQRTQGLAQVNEAAASVDFLRRALQFMGRFLRANRPILARVLADALSNDPIATEFLQRNLPRHLELLMGIIAAGQEDGTFRPLAPAQLLGFCAGSLAMPILFGGAVAERLPGTPTARNIDAALLTDEALDQRIELALAAISSPGRKSRAAPRARARKPRGKP